MRLGWTRAVPELTPDAAAVQAMVAAGLPGARVTGFAAAQGGLLNTNLCVTLAGPPHDVLLRLYQNDAARAELEMALARRLDGTVPVARFLHAGTHEAYRYALVEWIAGTRLELALGAMDAGERRAAGRSAGAALGAIHAVRFDKMGFLDAALTVATPIGEGPEFFLGMVESAFGRGPARARLGAALADAAIGYARRNIERRWIAPPMLAHCDFNGSNILVRGTEVAAVLDWEFAMSGTPDVDFGNLLRNHRDEDFLEGVLAAYREHGHAVPDDWRAGARLADLIAWANLLSRPAADPAVVASAKIAIGETVAD